jgi:hypothetical protein
MSPEQAEHAIWGWFAQVAHSRDRRTVMTPEDARALLVAQSQAEEQQKLSLSARIHNGLARIFSKREREEYGQAAYKDALAELEGGQDLRGKVNHATGLPESANDLETGRGIISGIDLCMAVMVPPYALAASVSAWLPPGLDADVDENWQVMAFKPMKTHCTDCVVTGRLKGPKCKPCRGRGRIRTGGLFSRSWKMCDPCQGHGTLPGPICPACKGKGTVDNWTEENHATVTHNARQIARKVRDLSKEGYFNPDPISKEDNEMGDLTWEDDEGLTIGFKLTYKGFKRMENYVEEHRDLRHLVHTLKYAGNDVRSQAPQWAQDEYSRAK